MSAVPTTLPLVPVTPALLASRAESKCETCRKRKIKCTPGVRDPNSDKPCDQCHKSGLTCGPNTVKIRARRISKPAQSTIGDHSERPRIASLLSVEHLQPPRDVSQSSSEEPSLTYQPPDSPESNERPGSPNDSKLSCAECYRRLRKIGPLIDLYSFVLHCIQCLERIKSVFRQYGMNSQLEAALFYLLQKTSDHIAGHFQRVNRLRNFFRVQSSKRELIGRRLLYRGYLFFHLHDNGPLHNDEMHAFRQAHKQLEEELYNYYDQNHGDGFEADHLPYHQPKTSNHWVGCSLQALQGIAVRIPQAVRSVLKGMPPRFIDHLSLKEPIEITVSHLMLMSSPLRSDLNPEECLPAGGTGPTGRNSFHIAAEVGNFSYLRHFIETSPVESQQFLAARDTFGLTPLMVAAYSRDLEVFKLLYRARSGRKERASNQRRTICLACMAGNVLIVKYILDRGEGIEEQIDWCSPLHDAIEFGKLEVVNLLMQYKANLHARFQGKTPAQWAQIHGLEDLARHLTPATGQGDHAEQSDPSRPVTESLKRPFSAVSNSDQVDQIQHTDIEEFPGLNQFDSSMTENSFTDILGDTQSPTLSDDFVKYICFPNTSGQTDGLNGQF